MDLWKAPTTCIVSYYLLCKPTTDHTHPCMFTHSSVPSYFFDFLTLKEGTDTSHWNSKKLWTNTMSTYKKGKYLNCTRSLKVHICILVIAGESEVWWTICGNQFRGREDELLVWACNWWKNSLPSYGLYCKLCTVINLCVKLHNTGSSFTISIFHLDQ